MLDNFLVVLKDDSDALIPYAISVAKALGARVVAVWPRREREGAPCAFLTSMTLPVFFAH